MKTYTFSINSFLVRELKISHKKALQLLQAQRVLVDGKRPEINQQVSQQNTIQLDDQVLQQGEAYTYLAYYKPRGIETTLKQEIPHNLADALNYPARVFPVGRLDKESEGLLLLTNDGSIFNKISHSKQEKEKEYIVTVDKPLTQKVIHQMRGGIEILGKKTRPSEAELLSESTFRIVLTQGLNRQIRRMCYKLGYEVTSLKRVRIITIELQDLNPGEFRKLSKDEIDQLIHELEIRRSIRKWKR